MELFCELTPKNAEVTIKRFNSHIELSSPVRQRLLRQHQIPQVSSLLSIHSCRNMKGFIIQGGDPTGEWFGDRMKRRNRKRG